MTRRKWIGVLFVAAVVVAAAIVVLRLGVTEDEAQPAAELVAPPEGMGMLWPMDRAWVWRIQRIPEGDWDRISLRIRSVSEEIQGRGRSWMTPRIREAEAEREVGVGLIALADDEDERLIRVAIQVIDPGELTRAGADADEPLLLLGHLQSAPVTSHLSDEEQVLPAGRASGHITHLPEWEGNELRLLTFFVDADGRRYRYDVVATVHGR